MITPKMFDALISESPTFRAEIRDSFFNPQPPKLDFERVMKLAEKLVHQVYPYTLSNTDKIPAIKLARAFGAVMDTSIGLKEAKDLVEGNYFRS